MPIDIAIPEQRAARIVQTAGAALVLTPERVAEICRPSVPDSGMAPRQPFETNDPQPRPQPDDPFYILFTSGSTGEPKGVIITHANLSAFVQWMRGEQRFGEGETFLNQAPFSFDLSVMDLYLSLVTGSTLFSITKDEIANLKLLYTALARSGVTTWVSTPSFAQMCLIERTFAEAMIPTLQRFLFVAKRSRRKPRRNCSTAFLAPKSGTPTARPRRPSRRLVRVDRALMEMVAAGRLRMPGTRVCILDENRHPSLRRTRRNCHRRPNVSPGYLGREPHQPRVLRRRAHALIAPATGVAKRDGLIFSRAAWTVR